MKETSDKPLIMEVKILYPSGGVKHNIKMELCSKCERKLGGLKAYPPVGQDPKRPEVTTQELLYDALYDVVAEIVDDRVDV